MKIYQTPKNWCDAIPKGYVDDIINVKIKKMIKAEYDLITPDPNTVYYVVDGSKVTQYLGEVKLTSGTVSAGSTTVMADGTAQAVSGAAQTIEEV